MPRPKVQRLKNRAEKRPRRSTYPLPQWRFAEMLWGLGSSRVIADKLVEQGYPRVPDSTIDGWRARNSIPQWLLLAIVQMALEARLIDSIEDLKPKPGKQLEHT